MHQNLRRATTLWAAAAVCSPLLFNSVSATAQTTVPTAPPLKIGFIYVSPVGQAGWTFQHDQGRRELEQALGAQVSTTVVEAVPEGPDAERVMRDLVAQGHQLIFATSFGYLEPALRVAAEFPHVKFMHAGGHRGAPNLATYNARYYEARYLAGMLAGYTSQRGVAGYVAGFAVPEVVQGLNAFTRGMRAVNPKAEVKVTWLNAWFDPARERDAALALVAQGADVLANHSGSPAVAQVAEEKGVKLVAYQSDMRAFAPKAQVGAVTHHWGSYYTQVARSVLNGTWSAQPVWAGMKAGMVKLSAVSPSLPAQVRDALARSERDIVAGRLLPFGTMSDEQIARMDGLVPGVSGHMPANARR